MRSFLKKIIRFFALVISKQLFLKRFIKKILAYSPFIESKLNQIVFNTDQKSSGSSKSLISIQSLPPRAKMIYVDIKASVNRRR